LRCDASHRLPKGLLRARLVTRCNPANEDVSIFFLELADAFLLLREDEDLEPVSPEEIATAAERHEDER